MSALTRFRDHCRAMANATRTGDWPPEAERRLWVQLADEIDDYLTGQADEDAAETPWIEQDGFDFEGSP